MAKTFDNVASDWAKHLKPFRKRAFWRKARREAKAAIRRGARP